MAERYSFSLTTFSPSGKLVQIEYALAAVAGGQQSVAIKSGLLNYYFPTLFSTLQCLFSQKLRCFGYGQEAEELAL